MTTDIIGFIGAGRVGEPVVRRLLAAGHEVLVYARRDQVRERLWIHGAALANSPAELAAHSDVLISCLYADSQLHEVCHGPAGIIANAKQGALLVSHTTGSVTTLEELATASAGEVTVLDAPVCGSAEDVAAGSATVLIGGPDSAIECVKPILAAYGRPIIPTGGLGTALHLKLINDLLFAANAQLVAAAAELAEKLCVAPPALLNALAVCSGGSAAAAHALVTGGVDAFASIAEPSLRKDVAAFLRTAQQVGADPGPLETIVRTGPLDLMPRHS
jgi:3-hydroxyisobutyrate dehydrogenase-like beta-hydroxyacid dehydrogenase